jgi:hypothetical protein
MSTADYDAVANSKHPDDKAILEQMCRGADIRKAFTDAGQRYMPAAQPIQVNQGGPGQSNGAEPDGDDVFGKRRQITHAVMRKEAEARAAVTGRTPEQEYDAMLCDTSPDGRQLQKWLVG